MIINPSSHSLGIFSSFHIFSNKGYSISTVMAVSTFSTSEFILSSPTALPYFNCDRASSVSFFVGGSRFISDSSLLLFSCTFLVSCLLPVCYPPS
jgi:hypothetical protein